MLEMNTLHSPSSGDNTTTGELTAHNSLWNEALCVSIMAQLWGLRKAMLQRESSMQPTLDQVLTVHRDSARNLIHYLSLRAVDLRPLQEQLATLGLSSLGRAESHVLASLDKVLGLLHKLTGQPWQNLSHEEPPGRVSSRALLADNTIGLLGDVPNERTVRIMVTLPSEAATDVGVARELVAAGMDVARINCAHDGPRQWVDMAKHVRKAAKAARRNVKILMDLGGPKIRTGVIAPGPAVLKLRPGKDDFGHVYRPARLGLQPMGEHEPLPNVDACIGVWDDWLKRLKVGSTIEFTDARGAKRHLLVTHCTSQGAVAECLRTCYFTPETVLHLVHPNHKKKHSSLVCHIAHQPGTLHLKLGDRLHLTRDGLDHLVAADEAVGDNSFTVARVPCTLPQVIEQVKVGERIWFDDGRIGGVIRQIAGQGVEVEITHARDSGEKLVADKGINLPDSKLDLPALTDKDITDLDTVAKVADMVGLSFVQKPDDVALLRSHLHRLKRDDMGLVLKIEMLQGFENLPDLMLAAMAANSAGVMIARGDLAVECGFERMAEVQEEILCCAEAAHMPVIWATQVLESLAKTGLPSRAEISDAGLGVRAECVMLNKGPFIADAIHTLDDILKRMAGHQAKKRPLLRALRAWNGGDLAA
ncbi:MAG: pyruvate kinase [Rhodoferax sp.]|uniref:pyruvate kinase n=1 Tax=Rhodoferax sp. TaxID=50421 RepID=UPI00262F1E1A|nr:pyruvate kinase [Rhodoferax sp.]MDD2882263.1 pyruvate kinase [Rhodoferax sp.]